MRTGIRVVQAQGANLFSRRNLELKQLRYVRKSRQARHVVTLTSLFRFCCFIFVSILWGVRFVGMSDCLIPVMGMEESCISGIRSSPQH